MEKLSEVVKLHFTKNKSCYKHWRMISTQILAVDEITNPKIGFIFDCGKINCLDLSDLLKKLKNESLIINQLILITLNEDFIILNYTKYIQHEEESNIFINISGDLSEPILVKDSSIITESILHTKNQITKKLSSEFIELVLSNDYCVPTIFGHLIGYPVLYWHSPNDYKNCLSCVDLNVFQIFSNNILLISFSIPNNLYINSPVIQKQIKNYLDHFQYISTFEIKTFIKNLPDVIL